MGRRESYSPKSMDDFYRNIDADPAELGQPGKTVKKEAGTAMADEPSSGATGKRQCRRNASAANSAGCHWKSTARPISKSQRLSTRKPVFVSETVRDELDRVVRYLGGKGMSASGVD